MRKTTYRMLTLVVLILCLFSIQIIVQKRLSINNDSAQIKPRLIPHAIHSSNVKGAAFVFLGLGPQAYQMNCPAAVESLVKHGGWGGDVYLITDRESCFDRKEIVRNAGMEDSKFHLEVLDEDFGGGGIDIFNPRLGFINNRMRSKSMKTHLFDIITEPEVEVIAYVDCDVLFAQEGCPANLVRSVKDSWHEEKIFFKKVHMDTHDRITGLHTGTIVMHREHSKEALRLWRQELEKANSPLDRLPYLNAYHRIRSALKSNVADNFQNSTISSITKDKERSELQHHELLRRKNPMTPGETVMIVNGTKIRYEKFVKEALGQEISCINHISKTQCELQGRQGIQEFVNRFQLASHGNGSYWYCPSVILSPFLYGWFPFSYLPFCPKIEQYL